ncbi:mediator of RNA polymerase II transcription subunit 6 [Rhipicephalus sanguineus]|uniref:Mediator of RNA polymerase II transcription subunit 6 n=1 Tax=Rhipicephalus sanguineus TaxID=34632 RepID=A0A9D4PPF6_RHISA|nr:mediator of RNA polymerase II transcription subunit 6 [Rhipicephalus sanguineus]KAH7950891.1 hypothetical protein HPB52_003074 [Rhipicephalus sanguineus]
MEPGKENPLVLSWHDTAWLPALDATNVMDYFSERSNPFYDRTCNNEIVKMQRLSPDQLNQMTGLEYVLLHTQDPILYVVRKQHRHSPTQVTPLADYYVLAGVVYQAPDLGSVLNSRLLGAAHSLQGALHEALGYSRYHPSRGYWWNFKDTPAATTAATTPAATSSSAASNTGASLFQRRRVDMLLAELAAKFPPEPPKPETADVKPAKAADKKQTRPAS